MEKNRKNGSLSEVWEKILLAVVIVFTVSALIYIDTAPPRKYKVGDCFQWKHNEIYYGKVTSVMAYNYRYIRYVWDYTQGWGIMRSDMVDKGTRKVKCPK